MLFLSFMKAGWKALSWGGNLETQSQGERAEKQSFTVVSLSKQEILSSFSIPAGWVWKDTPREGKQGRSRGWSSTLARRNSLWRAQESWQGYWGLSLALWVWGQWRSSEGWALQTEKPALHLTLPRPGHPPRASCCLPSVWKLSASLWGIQNALVRNLLQDDNQRTELGIYFFTFLLIQLDNIIRGRSPPVLAVSGWCMAGVDCVGGRRVPAAPEWSPPFPLCCSRLWHITHITQITRAAVAAPVSHVMFETSNILSLLINTVIMACQGFMLFLK